MSLNKKYLYILSSFLAGFSIMAVELVSARVMAPIIGSSVYTWTSVIGITLLGLALGSWAGGILADKVKNDRLLPLTFLASAVTVAIIPVLVPHTEFITNSSLGIATINLFLSLYLFFLPAVCVGLIQPIILKKYADDFSKIGSMYGILSATWSIGSVLGVFTTGFFFISTFGSKETMWLIAFVLLLTGSFHSKKDKLVLTLFIIGALLSLAVFNFTQQENPNTKVLFETETNYYKVRVVDKYLLSFGDARILLLDFDSHTIETKKPSHWLYSELYPAFGYLKKEINSSLFIGSGAYTLPKHVKDYYPNATVNVVELDPELEQVAKDYFELNKYDIQTTIGDARITLEKDKKTYDLIVGDAYNSFVSVPWYLLTKEWNEKVKSRLTPGGIYTIYFIGYLSGENNAFTKSAIVTFKKTFPNFYIFSFSPSETGLGNIALVGINGSQPLNELELLEKLAGGRNSFLADRLVPARDWPDNDQSLVLTDNFAPVEKLMAPVVKRYFQKHLAFIKTI